MCTAKHVAPKEMFGSINSTMQILYCYVACLVCIVLVLVLFVWYSRKSSQMILTFGAANQSLTGYVIHLLDRVDRKENVAKLLSNASKVGINLVVVDAVDGRYCHSRRVRSFLDFSMAPGHWRDHMRGGEQGCLASLLKAFALCKDSDRKTGTFFIEDDAVVPVKTFEIMSALLNAHQDRPLVLHGRRSYPSGWTDRQSVVKENETEGKYIAGWRTIMFPNYSTAFFALTVEGQQSLWPWLDYVKHMQLHMLPADDLLSVACGAHPTTREQDSQVWEKRSSPLLGLAPINKLATVLHSASDTERRTPFQSKDNVRCDFL